MTHEGETRAPRNGGRKKRKKRSVIKTILWILLFTFLMTAGVLTFMIFTFMNDSRDMTLDSVNLNQSSVLYYQDNDSGEWLEQEKLWRGSDRQWVSIDQIPKYMQDAAVAIEDKRFYEHNGVDWVRTGGATLSLLTGKQQFGGSTITQQLVKNITNDDEVSLKRKIQEIFRAHKIDSDYSKEQILEYYLNTIYLGQNCNGVQTAAKTYFNKDVSELSLAESAAIVGITQYPVKYDPFLHPENNKERQETILREMCSQGMISEQEQDEAIAEELVFTKEITQQERNSKQSYYTDQVISDVIRDLMEQYDYNKEYATQLVYSGGLKIYTAMDKDVQDAMDSVFIDNDNFPLVVGSRQPEAAMTIIDPYTGQIKGIVGGKGEKTGDRTLNRASQSKRQPGSAIKPIAVYAPALEMNLITPASVYDDSPFVVKDRYPKNYYEGYRGLLTVEKALEISTNPVPMRILNELGFEQSYAFMTDNLGISTLVKEKVTSNNRVLTDLTSSLSLGGLTYGMTVTELTAAYVPFANRGQYREPHTYLRVEDSKGNILLENKEEPIQAMGEDTAYLMNEMLQNVVENGTGAGAKIGHLPTAGKTGTTSDDYDRWFVGYTPYYVGTVWYGFDNNKTIVTRSGTNPALSIWRQVMQKIHKDKEKTDFYEVEGLVKASYCLDSGLAPTDKCKNDVRGSRVATGLFKAGTAPTDSCNVHVSATLCADSGQIAGPYCTNTMTRSLLNFKREFPYEIAIRDAQYTYLPMLGSSSLVPGAARVVYSGLLSSGMNPGYSPDVSAPVNYCCALHTGVPEPEEPPEENPTEPTPGEDPNTPSEPTDPNNPNPPEEKPPENPGEGENPPAEKPGDGTTQPETPANPATGR